MEIILIILIGVSLSMDAFSLAICYGILGLERKTLIILSSIVGIYHFFMPQIGMVCGHFLENFILIDMRYVVFIIFLLLGIEMITSVFKRGENIILLNSFGLFLFGFTVSIDSFSAGIGIEFISDRHLLCSIIFSVISFLFTFAGLKIGGSIGNKFKDSAPIIGGIMLILLSFLYLYK